MSTVTGARALAQSAIRGGKSGVERSGLVCFLRVSGVTSSPPVTSARSKMASTHESLRLLLLLSSSLTVIGACPEGFFQNGDWCYAVPQQLATWPEARVYCQAIGADLAVIETQEEQTFLSTRLKSILGGHNAQAVWVDGEDLLKEGAWQWTRTGQRIQSTFWARGEPNNDQGKEHCLSLDPFRQFYWNDNLCIHRRNFLCEMPHNGIFIG